MWKCLMDPPKCRKLNQELSRLMTSDCHRGEIGSWHVRIMMTRWASFAPSATMKGSGFRTDSGFLCGLNSCGREPREDSTQLGTVNPLQRMKSGWRQSWVRRQGQISDGLISRFYGCSHLFRLSCPWRCLASLRLPRSVFLLGLDS